MLTWTSIMFQEPKSDLLEEIIWTHEIFIIEFLTLSIPISLFFIFSKKKKNSMKKIYSSQLMELSMGVLPLMFLAMIVITSCESMFVFESNPLLLASILVVANQWFWNYEYSTLSDTWNFDSCIISDQDTLWCLDVDNRLPIFASWDYQILITSNDVIHSFSIPSLGIKMDAMPGRLNNIIMNSNTPGVFFGQCSEICGVYHSFMPIVVEAMFI